MTPSHHPDDATLMSLAAGSLPAALAAAVAGHLSFCARCRREMQVMELIGGAVMRGLPTTAMAAPVEFPTSEPEIIRTPPDLRQSRTPTEIPPPIADLIGSALDDLPWSRLAAGLYSHVVPMPARTDGQLQLIKAAPGHSIPEHGHRGQEVTLVLRGAYRDIHGEFGPGDLADLDETIHHLPIAHAELGCICLVASEHPPAFRGFIPRLVQSLRK